MAPRRTFTVKEKAEIISKLRNGEKNGNLCKEYKVSHSTISMMWKNRDQILECFESKSLKIKKNRKPTHQDVENALLMWFKAQRSQNVPLSGRLLREKANQFARLFGKTDFECSESWIYRFRQRHNIIVGKVCGEAVSVLQSDCDNWLKTVFPKLIEDYTDSQIWNADETGLFFKLTPEETWKFKGEKCVDGKLSEDRITVLVASSTAGEKRKLLVIGKEKEPRCFKNVKSLPVDYESNKKAWMTSEIFEKVLRKWDSQLRNNKKKIILFIDNCPAHPKIENLTNIKLAFLPSNTTSVIQPIDQGIIKTLKSHYRKILVQKMMNDIEKMAGQFSFNLLDAIEMLTTAWARVTPGTIRKCFLRAGFCKSSAITKIDDDSDDELDTPLAQLTTTSLSSTNVADWETYVDIDSQLITTRNLSDSEIVEYLGPSHTTQYEEKKEEEEDCKQARECKDKWKNLRTVFTRKLKPRPGGSGARKKPYYLADLMQFTLPFIKTTTPLSGHNVFEVPNTDDSAEVPKEDETERYHGYDDDLPTSPSSPWQSNPSPTSSLVQVKDEETDVSSQKDYNIIMTAKRTGEFDVDESMVNKDLVDTDTNYRSTEAVKQEATKMFLLSLIPELTQLTDSQIKIFKRRVLALIDDISEQNPLDPLL